MEDLDLAVDFQCAWFSVCVFHVSGCEFDISMSMLYWKLTSIAYWENIGRSGCVVRERWTCRGEIGAEVERGGD